VVTKPIREHPDFKKIKAKMGIEGCGIVLLLIEILKDRTVTFTGLLSISKYMGIPRGVLAEIIEGYKLFSVVNNQVVTYDESADKPINIDCNEIMAMFNRICTSMPRVKTITIPRKTMLRSWASELNGDISVIETVFTKANASDFLSGRDGKWMACFDWIIQPANRTKILEGNYNKTAKQDDEHVIL
jgi:hypothetical protein